MKTKKLLLIEFLSGIIVVSLSLVLAIKGFPQSNSPILGVAIGIGIWMSLNSTKEFFKGIAISRNKRG